MRFGLWCRGIDYIPIDLKIPAGGNGGGTWHPPSNRTELMEFFDDFFAMKANIYGGQGGLWQNPGGATTQLTTIGGVIAIATGALFNFHNGGRNLRNTNAGENCNLIWRGRITSYPPATKYIGFGFWIDNLNWIAVGCLPGGAGNFRYMSMVAGALQVSIDTTILMDNLFHEFRVQINHADITFSLDGANLQVYNANPGVDWLRSNWYPCVFDTGNTGSVEIDYVYGVQTGFTR